MHFHNERRVMSQILNLELSDEIFAVIQHQAKATVTSSVL
jgi:hypothetical protein